MSSKLLSIYITSDVTSICEVSRSGKNVALHRVFEVDTPKGCYEDGSILDPFALAGKLRGIIDLNKLKNDKLLFTISSKKIANKELLFPYVKNTSRIKDMIISNAQDYFPMSNTNDYVYDFSILELVQGESGKQYRVSAIAVQKELINSYKALASDMKMPIEAIDYQGNSVLQIFQMQAQVQEGLTLVLQIEKELTNVSFMRGKCQIFRRTVPFGMDSVAQSLAEIKHMTEGGALELLRSDERMVREVRRSEYLESIREIVGAIARVVEFYNSRNPEMVIESARLYGENGAVEGLSNILQEELGIKVSSPKTLDGVLIKGKDIKADIDLTKYLSNLGAVVSPIGLGLTGDKSIEKNAFLFFYLLLGTAAIASSALVGITVFTYYNSTVEKRELEGEIAKIQDVGTLYDAYQKTHASLQRIKDFYNATSSNSEQLYQFFCDLETVMPESVGFSSLSVKNGEVKITGITDGKEPLAAFIMELKKLPYISGIWCESYAEVYDLEGKTASGFNMSFNMVKPEEHKTEEEQVENTVETVSENSAGPEDSELLEDTGGGE